MRPEDALADDAAFDAWLTAADAGVLEQVDAALDLDAGRAAIFAPAVPTETVPAPDRGEDGAVLDDLEVFLRDTTASIERWLALAAPGYLPYQLDKVSSTVRTMTVVGRALLPETMRLPWGLATDFLTSCQSTVIQLKTGLAHRELTRSQALDLQRDIQGSIGNFHAALRHTDYPRHGRKATQVCDLLLAAAEMVQLLLQRTRDGIEHLFDDPNQPTRQPVS